MKIKIIKLFGINFIDKRFKIIKLLMKKSR